MTYKLADELREEKLMKEEKIQKEKERYREEQERMAHTYKKNHERIESVVKSEAKHPVVVERERQRQMWSPHHDSEYEGGELIAAAICYLRAGDCTECDSSVPSSWPWNPVWFKPSTISRNLEKAGALIMAEHDRLAWKQRVEARENWENAKVPEAENTEWKERDS